MQKNCVVQLTKFAEKQITKLPKHIVEALKLWVHMVQSEGVWSVRRRLSYHDESLKGKRAGERSVRLSRSYRAIYIEEDEKEVFILAVQEINKHDY